MNCRYLAVCSLAWVNCDPISNLRAGVMCNAQPAITFNTICVLLRAEPIMLKKYPFMLCCTAPKSAYYAQIMLIKCDPHSENQPSGLF